jgi:hypothetical protein
MKLLAHNSRYFMFFLFSIPTDGYNIFSNRKIMLLDYYFAAFLLLLLHFSYFCFIFLNNKKKLPRLKVSAARVGFVIIKEFVGNNYRLGCF